MLPTLVGQRTFGQVKAAFLRELGVHVNRSPEITTATKLTLSQDHRTRNEIRNMVGALNLPAGD